MAFSVGNVGVKAVIFMLFCTSATLNPFVSLILQDNGFTVMETGKLISLSKILTLCLTPLVCAFADSHHCHVTLLMMLALAASVLMVTWYSTVPLHNTGGHAAVSGAHLTQDAEERYQANPLGVRNVLDGPLAEPQRFAVTTAFSLTANSATAIAGGVAGNHTLPWMEELNAVSSVVGSQDEWLGTVGITAATAALNQVLTWWRQWWTTTPTTEAGATRPMTVSGVPQSSPRLATAAAIDYGVRTEGNKDEEWATRPVEELERRRRMRRTRAPLPPVETNPSPTSSPSVGAHGDRDDDVADNAILGALIGDDPKRLQRVVRTYRQKDALTSRGLGTAKKEDGETTSASTTAPKPKRRTRRRTKTEASPATLVTPPPPPPTSTTSASEDSARPMQFDVSFICTAMVLGLYAAFGGSKLVITDTVVLKQLEAAAASTEKENTEVMVTSSSPSSAQKSAASFPFLSSPQTQQQQQLLQSQGGGATLPTGMTIVVPANSGSANPPTCCPDENFFHLPTRAEWAPPSSTATQPSPLKWNSPPTPPGAGSAVTTNNTAVVVVPVGASAGSNGKKKVSAASAYPMQRLWGSFSYGLTAFSTGMAVRLYAVAAAATTGMARSTAAEGTAAAVGVADTPLRPYRVVLLIHAFFLILFAGCVYLVLVRHRGPNASPTTATKLKVSGTRGKSSDGAHPPSNEVIRTTATTPSTSTDDTDTYAEVPPLSPLAPQTVGGGGGSPTVVTVTGWNGGGTTAIAGGTAAAGVTAVVNAVPVFPFVDHATVARQRQQYSLLLQNYQTQLNNKYCSSKYSLRVYRYLGRDLRLILPLFAGVVFLCIGEGVAQIFLFPYLRRELGAPPQLFSYIMLVHMISEIAAYRFSASLLRRFAKDRLYSLGALCYATKMAVYSRIRNPYWLLLTELLHGACVSLPSVTSVALVTGCARDAELFFKADLDATVRMMEQDLAVLRPAELATEATTTTTMTTVMGGGCSVQDRRRLQPGQNPVHGAAYTVELNGADAHSGSAFADPTAATNTAFTSAGADHLRSSSSTGSGGIEPTGSTGYFTQSSLPRLRLPPIEVLSTALSLMWFASTGIPSVMAGMLPACLTWWDSTSPFTNGMSPSAGAVEAAEPVERRLFGGLCFISLTLAVLFFVYGRTGLLK